MAWRGLALGLVLVLGAGKAWGDSWMSPRTFERKSSGGEYVVAIKPALRGDEKMRISAGELSVRKAGEAKVLWRAKLSNEVSPTDAMVSDDGRAVVTFDN